MKKQHLLVIHIRRCAYLTLICLGLLFSGSALAKQTILLDANGNPLSDDVLLLLSNANGRFNTPSSSPKNDKKSTTKSISNKKKTISDPILEAELLEDLKAGRTARVKQLLKKGVKPTYKNAQGETPLGIAVTRGWASMVNELLDHGADIHEKGARGVTLLHIASARGLTDVAKLLVKRGLNPGQKTDKNWTPLHVAARYGHWQLVQYFVQIGVDPDIRNSDGKTALGLARHLRHAGIIKILSRVTTVRSLDFKPHRKKHRKKRKSRR